MENISTTGRRADNAPRAGDQPKTTWRVDLSGGGVRSTLAAIGGFYALRVHRPTEPVSMIVSVSGGSLASAAIADADADLCGPDPNRADLDQLVRDTAKRITVNGHTRTAAIAFAGAIGAAAAFQRANPSWLATWQAVAIFFALSCSWLIACAFHGHVILPTLVVAFVFACAAVDIGSVLTVMMTRLILSATVFGVIALMIGKWVPYRRTSPPDRITVALLFGVATIMSTALAVRTLVVYGIGNAPSTKQLVGVIAGASVLAAFTAGTIRIATGIERKPRRQLLELIGRAVFTVAILGVGVSSVRTRPWLTGLLVAGALLVVSRPVINAVHATFRAHRAVDRRRSGDPRSGTLMVASTAALLWFAEALVGERTDMVAKLGFAITTVVLTISSIVTFSRLHPGMQPGNQLERAFRIPGIGKRARTVVLNGSGRIRPGVLGAVVAAVIVLYGFISANRPEALRSSLVGTALAAAVGYALFGPRFFASVIARAAGLHDRFARVASLPTDQGSSASHVFAVASLRTGGPAYFLLRRREERAVAQFVVAGSSDNDDVPSQRFDASRCRFSTIVASSAANLPLIPYVPLALLPECPVAHSKPLESLFPLIDGGVAGTIGTQVDDLLMANTPPGTKWTKHLVIDATSPRRPTPWWPLLMIPAISGRLLAMAAINIAVSELAATQRRQLDEGGSRHTFVASIREVPQTYAGITRDTVRRSQRVVFWWPTRTAAEACLLAGCAATLYELRSVVTEDEAAVTIQQLRTLLPVRRPRRLRAYAARARGVPRVGLRNGARYVDTLTPLRGLSMALVLSIVALFGLSMTEAISARTVNCLTLPTNSDESWIASCGAVAEHQFFADPARSPIIVSHEGNWGTTKRAREKPIEIKYFMGSPKWLAKQDKPDAIRYFETDIAYRRATQDIVAFHKATDNGPETITVATSKVSRSHAPDRWADAAKLDDMLGVPRSRWFLEINDYQASDDFLGLLKTRLNAEPAARSRVCLTFGNIENLETVTHIRDTFPGYCSCASLPEKAAHSDVGIVRFLARQPWRKRNPSARPESARAVRATPSSGILPVQFNCVVVNDLTASA